MNRPIVLILEADETVVGHFSACFEEAGFEPMVAISFAEAFQTLKARARDIAWVILDFELATDDVLVLERLRKLDFDRPLPVFLLGRVALDREEIDQLKADSGYAGYLHKSMTAPAILTEVKRQAGGRENLRRYERVLCQLPARLCHGDRLWEGEVQNLSLSGAFFRIRQPENLPEMGVIGEISFVLKSGQSPLVALPVEVVFRRCLQEGVVSIYARGVGLKFVRMGKQEEEVLLRLVNELREMSNENH